MKGPWGRILGISLLLAVQSITAGGHASMDETLDQETQSLFEELNGNDVAPDVLEAGMPDFSEASKNELVKRAAKEPQPTSSGKFLSRLVFLQTKQNRPSIISVYENHLTSSDASARKASLYGLQELQHPELNNFAIQALEDEDDQVLFAACSILLNSPQQNQNERNNLQALYEKHRGKDQYYMTLSLLEGHGFGSPQPK